MKDGRKCIVEKIKNLWDNGGKIILKWKKKYEKRLNGLVRVLVCYVW